MKPSAVEQAKEEAAKSQTDDEKQFTLEEIQKHNTPDDAWIIIDNKVYDVTSVLSWHPGGAAAITNYAGKATVDTTVDYNAIHDDYANSQRDKLLIGRVSDKGIKALAEDAERAKKVQAKLNKNRAGFALKASR
jgi:nitrate reductase (NAD(P)H)